MAKFRNRPTIVDAVQWFPGKQVDGVVIDAVDLRPSTSCFKLMTEYPIEPHIQTLEGRMFVSAGDWVVTGTHGERWPVKPHIFKIKYEPVDDEATVVYIAAYSESSKNSE